MHTPMNNPKDVTQWTVLIVDDEPDSIEIVTQVLRHYGATVHTATNGQGGLDAVRQVKPTFILSDLSMPVVDGWEMIRQLKADPRTKDIPVIALTAHAMTGDRERALGVGFHYYLTKPFRPRTLLTDLLALLELPVPSADLIFSAAEPAAMNTPAAEEKAAPSLESPKPAQPTAEPVAATEKNAVLSSDSARPSAEPAAVNAPALEKKTDPPKPEQSPTSGEPAIPGAKEEK